MQKCIISAKVVIKIDSPIRLKYVVEHVFCPNTKAVREIGNGLEKPKDDKCRPLVLKNADFIVKCR